VTRHPSDADAEEQAELAELHDRAARRRAELGATVREMAQQVHDGQRLRAWAVQAAWQAARGSARAARNAAFRAATAGRSRTTAVPAVAVLTVCVAAGALTWRLRHGRPGRPRRPRPGG
jgi:hypothetical protein